MAFNAPTLQSSIAPFILLVPEVGIAPTSPRLQRGANLPQLLGVRLRALRYDAIKMARRAEARRAKAGRPGR